MASSGTSHPQLPVAETVGAMAELVRAGLHIGLSEVTPEQLEQAVANHPIAAVQFEVPVTTRMARRGA